MEDGGEAGTMYHGVDRRKLGDRRKGERRGFGPNADEGYEKRAGRDRAARGKQKNRRKRIRREDNHLAMDDMWENFDQEEDVE